MTGFDRAAIETGLHECETAGADMHPSYVRECLAEIDRLTSRLAEGDDE